MITRTPFRISFCGGGTDLPSYYLENGGCVLRASINKYVHVTNNLMLFYIGGTRKVLEVIKSHFKKNLDKNLCEGGEIKKSSPISVSNPDIDDAYRLAIDSGAVGKKLLGAGGMVSC